MQYLCISCLYIYAKNNDFTFLSFCCCFFVCVQYFVYFLSLIQCVYLHTLQTCNGNSKATSHEHTRAYTGASTIILSAFITFTEQEFQEGRRFAVLPNLVSFFKCMIIFIADFPSSSSSYLKFPIHM